MRIPLRWRDRMGLARASTPISTLVAAGLEQGVDARCLDLHQEGLILIRINARVAVLGLSAQQPLDQENDDDQQERHKHIFRFEAHGSSPLGKQQHSLRASI